VDDDGEGTAEVDPELGSTGGRVGVSRGDRLEGLACVGALGVEEEVGGLVVPPTTGGDEAGLVFFLVDLGVRSRRRASRFPMAVVASPTSRLVPRIVTTREPERTSRPPKVYVSLLNFPVTPAFRHHRLRSHQCLSSSGAWATISPPIAVCRLLKKPELTYNATCY
jgi:hypothetical protein